MLAPSPDEKTSLLRAISELVGISEAWWLEETDSTNTHAFLWHRKERLPDAQSLWYRREHREAGHEFRLVIADRQSNGRGRGDHRWLSPEGCLMLSLFAPIGSVVRPRVEWGQIAMLAGLGAAKAIEETTPTKSVHLKWPNDLFTTEGKKLGGILIETGQALVVGTGVNVTCAPNRMASLDAKWENTGGNLSELLCSLVQQQTELLLRWNEQSLTDWQSLWQRRCFLSGRKVRVQQQARTIAGTCLGVDPSGALLIETQSGCVQIDSGSVEVV